MHTERYQLPDEVVDEITGGAYDEPKQLMAQRQLAMADSLRQGAMTPDQGQMVSGHYVSPGWGGAVRQVASGLAGGYMNQQGQEGLMGVAGEQQGRRKTAYGARQKALGAIPAPAAAGGAAGVVGAMAPLAQGLEDYGV
jgi:hypothetical protein